MAAFALHVFHRMHAVRPLEPERSEDLETFFWNSVDLMAVLDGELQVLKTNPAFERTLGPQVGQSILEVCAPRDRARVAEALRGGFHARSRNFDAAVIRPSQALRSCEWAVFPNATGDRLHVVVRDTTVRRRLEKELAQAHKLEAIGQLASGIAHEINTPIQFVGDNLTFLGESLPPLLLMLDDIRASPQLASLLTERGADLEFLRKEVPEAVGQACEGIQRVAELVAGMKEFAHQDGGELRATDLNHALERTITVARNEWKHAAEIVTEFDPALPMVTCVASALRQVFLNLLCNAAYAVAERNGREGRKTGLITVKTSQEGDFVTVAIRDDGGGIPDAVKERLFEPFFTTKPVGRGTGQGLAISRIIVCEKHGGALDFETAVGHGTTFFVRLPVTHALVGRSTAR